MNRIFSYDFLKLEFRDIYEDIEELRKKTTHDDIEKNINALIGDIIYYIYKKNSILYDEKIQWNKRLEMLKEINIIPSEILDMIILWSNKVKVNHSDIITAEDKISEMKILYEILFKAKEYLKEKGCLYLVINKDQGAKSLYKDLQKFYSVTILEKNKGFYIFKCQKN